MRPASSLGPGATRKTSRLAEVPVVHLTSATHWATRQQPSSIGRESEKSGRVRMLDKICPREKSSRNRHLSRNLPGCEYGEQHLSSGPVDADQACRLRISRDT